MNKSVLMPQDQFDVCRSRFCREMRYTHALSERNEYDIKETRSLVENAKKRCLEMNISEDSYKQFCIKYYDIYVEEMEQIAIRSKCLKWMIHVQSLFGKKDVFDPACLVKYGKCKNDCCEFEKANDKQIEWFECALDINTGNQIQVVILELDDETNSKFV